jgi:hypothetical protein
VEAIFFEGIKRKSSGHPLDIHPNAICGILTHQGKKAGVPVINDSTARELSTVRIACWLSNCFTYWWLENHSHSHFSSTRMDYQFFSF